MLHSTERILVTHTGSLPRPRELIEAMLAENEGRALDPADYEEKLLRSVHDIVRRQMDLGVDIVDDGELSKRGFAVYAHQRLDGLTATGRVRVSPWDNSRESQAFPEFYAATRPVAGKPNPSNMQMACTGPITYRAQERLAQDLANLRAAVDQAGPVEVFVPAISPCDVAGNIENALRGSALQDRRRVPVRHRRRPEGGAPGAHRPAARALRRRGRPRSPAATGFGTQARKCRRLVLPAPDRRPAAHQLLRQEPGPGRRPVPRLGGRADRGHQPRAAYAGIPEDRVRYHTCYGINMGPRVHDMEMKDYIDIVLKIRAGAFSFEARNRSNPPPRHEHEWRIWEDVKLPEGQARSSPASSPSPPCWWSTPSSSRMRTSLIRLIHAEGVPDGRPAWNSMTGRLAISSTNLMDLFTEKPCCKGLERFAAVYDYATISVGVVGRENVIAGSDCGFGTQAMEGAGDPSRHRLGQVPGHVRGRAAGEPAAVGVR